MRKLSEKNADKKAQISREKRLKKQVFTHELNLVKRESKAKSEDKKVQISREKCLKKANFYARIEFSQARDLSRK